MSELTNLTREIVETFEVDNEDPIATGDFLTATNPSQYLDPLQVVDGQVVSGSLKIGGGKAWKDPAKDDTPKHADQEARAIGFIVGENILKGSELVSAVSKSGSNVVLTLGSKLLLRPIGSAITFTIIGSTGFTPTLNNTWVGTVISATMVQFVDPPFTVFGSAFGTIEVADCFFGVFLRVDPTVSVSSFSPKGGYVARLVFDPEAKFVSLYRWERDTGIFQFITSGADIDGASINKNPAFGVAASEGRGVLQELRLTVEDTDDGGTRVKVYLNNDDNTKADVDVTDRAENTPKGPGVWGLEIGGGAIGIDAWYASDKFRDPNDGNVQGGRMLSEIRADLVNEISRGTGSALEKDPTFLNRAVNRALQIVMKDLGSLAWWLQTEETFQITSTDTRTFELPPRVESVEAFYRADDRGPYGRSIWAIGYNAAGTALIFQSRLNLDGLEVITQYYRQWGEMLGETDRAPIPRQHDELLVIAAALNVARRTGDGSWIGALNGYYKRLLMTTKSYLNRQKRQQRTNLRVESPNRDRFSETRYVPDINWLW